MKTNKLFVAFVAVLLCSCILQIYFANSIMRTAETPITSIAVSSSTIPNVERCEGVQTATIKCPMGDKTSPAYHQSMDFMYGSVKNRELFNKCSELELPLTEKSPMECWPRLIILPSHATSGSQLIRGILDLIGLNPMSQYNEEPNGIDKLFAIESLSLDIWGSKNTSSAIPFMQHPAIFKSHISQSKSTEERQKMKKMLEKANSMGLLHGIIRLARNPGDQLLRNKFRWKARRSRKKKRKVARDRDGPRALGEDKDEVTFSDFIHGSMSSCRVIAGTGHDSRSDHTKTTWSIFHKFWDDITDIPNMAIHYETITSKNNVSTAIKSVIDFLDENTVGYDLNYLNSAVDQKLDQINLMLKELEYEHGTLMATVCGVEAARRLHAETREYSRALRYAFNKSTGYWSLKV